MAHQKHHQVAGIISEDIDDERRLHECARKYETIVKQFDELVGIMSNGNAVSKQPRSQRGGASGGRGVASSSQPNKNQTLVQTVTRFLHELRSSSTDSEYSRSNSVEVNSSDVLCEDQN